MSRRLHVVVAVLVLANAVVVRSATLNIGDKPPVLDVGFWIRKPAAPAKANAIRIVTFFSTWSEPCREALPVLRQVA